MSASQVGMDDVEEGASEKQALSGFFSKPVAEKDEASMTLVALRDVAILAALLSLFGAAEAWAQVSGLAFASLVATVDGLLVGAATCALAHEWGHFAGARLGGGHAPLKKISAFPQLFDFDYLNNEQRAFDWMSFGGNVAHVAIPLVYLFAIGATRPRHVGADRRRDGIRRVLEHHRVARDRELPTRNERGRSARDDSARLRGEDDALGVGRGGVDVPRRLDERPPQSQTVQRRRPAESRAPPTRSAACAPFKPQNQHQSQAPKKNAPSSKEKGAFVRGRGGGLIQWGVRGWTFQKKWPIHRHSETR